MVYSLQLTINYKLQSGKDEKITCHQHFKIGLVNILKVDYLASPLGVDNQPKEAKDEQAATQNI